MIIQQISPLPPLVNTAPQIDVSSIPASENIYENEAVPVINFNDSSFGSDFDYDGDVIAYTCKYDNIVDGSVASAANDCTTILNEGAGTYLFFFYWYFRFMGP